MSSVMSVTAPTELDASVEIASLTKSGWPCSRGHFLTYNLLMLGDQNSTVVNPPLKAESDLGFDVGMVAMRPADVLWSTAYSSATGRVHPDSSFATDRPPSRICRRTHCLPDW